MLENYKNIPSSAADLFGAEMITSPHSEWEKIRSKGPLVYMEPNKILFISSHKVAQKCISDSKTFISGKGIGIRDIKDYVPPRIPSLLLETDPPEHDRYRKIMMQVLSPGNISGLRTQFEAAAEKLADNALRMGTFDAVSDFVRPFTLNVIADAVGVPEEGREHLLNYGTMVIESSGPDNYRFQRALARAKEAGSIEWVMQMMKRGSLRDNGFGAKIFDFVDAGELTEPEAELLVRIFLNASVDSTICSITNGLKLIAEHKTAYEAMRADNSLCRNAFEETMRVHGAVKYLFRTASADVDIEGVNVLAGQRIALGVGIANRDPEKFDNPNTFDISRRVAGHVAFGVGIHACSGQMVARLEADVLYKALVNTVGSLKVCGVPEPLDSNIFTSWSKLPLRANK
ncbi:UNVERIFIED_ORG: cytochrome P450 [Pseudomonas lini]